MARDRHDVVIVGAGVAGLAAARALTAAGLDVGVVEARGRVGGRIHTLHRADHPLPIELGAEFIDLPGPAWDALRQAGGAAWRSRGGVWELRRGRATRLDMEALTERTLGKLDPPPREDLPFAEWIRDRGEISPRDRRRVLAYVEGFHAARTERVGVRWLAEASEGSGGGGGAVRHHPLSGFSRVPEAMLARLGPEFPLRLNHVVTEVIRGSDEVEIRGRARSGGALDAIVARAVLLTVPLGVLQAPAGEEGAIRFDPPLEARLSAARSLAVGSVLKLSLRFREAFWERAIRFPRGAGEEEHKLFMTGGLFPTWWTASPVVAPVLTAWAGGGAVARVREAGAPIDAAVASLAEALGMQRRSVEQQLEEWQFHDWDADPFARGAYSYVPAGALPAQRELGAPIDGVIYLAGEATATGGANGTVDGAIETGVRAAGEIIAALGPQ